jgi:hypothetical protein
MVSATEVHLSLLRWSTLLDLLALLLMASGLLVSRRWVSGPQVSATLRQMLQATPLRKHQESFLQSLQVELLDRLD